MNLRLIAGLIPAAALAACGGNAGGNDSSASSSGPVAAKAAPAGKSWTEVVSQTPEGGYRMGNPDAPIKLIEYGSRTCPVCGEFGRTGTQPLENNYVKTGKVSWEFRDYMVHGQPDIPASLLGRCVDEAAFFPMLEQMYVNQGPIEEKLGSKDGQALFQRLQGAPPAQAAQAWADYLGYLDFVKQRGLPEAKARACLADTKALDRIAQMMSAGDQMGVTGTPSFFVNGTKSDAITWGQLEPALKAAGA